ncbi:putative Trans-1,2-dihydrobenzene-1,2-diol dehydrogenase [Hyaloscypha variabilis]|uniref:D-xylose 1-dehydrogenase (NADP(+), D-xylono-1,5-lactone-forming) n=1 Tax=Hyaloscypha variabilis (strain UAMH 11265 / GT02V1 / F) TaxID=1149755 RepID=A0A2J6RKD5_HYAVF|nr:putative Trans-1,2-dihydrobenzene-1,2-diol dehydrogenase [Hyaloscypha variabilis F]
MASKYTVRWGILATGGIATTFTKDFLTNPATRGVHDVQHVLAAAASSSSKSRAEAFIKDVDGPSSAKAYGSYHELVKDPNVDIIYVATPHSHHFQNTMLALEHGKNVLCEKAFTVNAAQARKLVETAREKKLFLMEAVWTRYFPLSIKIRELVKDGVIGKVHRVTADLSIAEAKDDGGLDFPDSHRMVNPDLAGGALLDLGIYSLTWVYQILYHCQEGKREKPEVLGAVQKYKTGADELTSILLNWPGQKTQGFASTSLRVATNPDGEGSPAAAPAVRIQGTKGEIQVFGMIFRPLHYRVILAGGKSGQVEDVHCPIPTDKERKGKGDEGVGHGMFWEADEAARCLRDGKLESDTLNWEESIAIMEAMDAVRKQGGLVYPELIETAVYDEKSPLNGEH